MADNLNLILIMDNGYIIMFIPNDKKKLHIGSLVSYDV